MVYKKLLKRAFHRNFEDKSIQNCAQHNLFWQKPELEPTLVLFDVMFTVVNLLSFFPSGSKKRVIQNYKYHILANIRHS